MTAISPRISQAIETIGQDRTHGAGWLARDAVNVLTHSLDDCPAQTAAEFLSYLRSGHRSGSGPTAHGRRDQRCRCRRPGC